jgi:hypothetical protein
MTQVVASIAILAIGLIAVTGGLRYLWFRVRREVSYEKATAEFYEASNPLALDKDSPFELLDLIDGLNCTITDKRMALSMLRYAFQDTWWKEKFIPPSERTVVVDGFLKRRPELEASFRKMVVSWFIAVTALSPLVGAIVRFAMSGPSVEQAASRASKESTSHRDDHFHPNMSAAGIC